MEALTASVWGGDTTGAVCCAPTVLAFIKKKEGIKLYAQNARSRCFVCLTVASLRGTQAWKNALK